MAGDRREHRPPRPRVPLERLPDGRGDGTAGRGRGTEAPRHRGSATPALRASVSEPALSVAEGCLDFSWLFLARPGASRLATDPGQDLESTPGWRPGAAGESEPA